MNVIVENFILSVDKTRLAVWLRLRVLSYFTFHFWYTEISVNAQLFILDGSVNMNLLILLTNGLSRFCLALDAFVLFFVFIGTGGVGKIELAIYLFYVTSYLSQGDPGAIQ